MKRSLRSWLWRVPLDQEVEEELAFHIEMRTRELVERGLDPAAAREVVLSRMGDLGQLKRTCEDLGRKRDREMRFTRFLDELSSDVVTALRQMKASPLLTLVAMITLALGIGANTAIFALADATLLRPLPFTTPADRLVMLSERFPNGFLSQVTAPDYADWAAQNRTFDAMASFVSDSVALVGTDGVATQVRSQTVSAAFFDILGVTPVLGRTFAPDDTVAANMVVLSEGFWRSQFGGDPSIVGRSIVVAERPQTVIGVVPDRFRVVPISVVTAGSEPPSLWTLVTAPAGGNVATRRAHFLYVIGRLKSGVTRDVAQQDMTAIGLRIAQQFPDTNQGHEPAVQPLREAIVGSEMRLTSLLLLGVVGFVLLMCCANLAHLFLARTNARARELAVRAALGATRGRVIAQLLTESLVLALAGGLIGAGLGAAILRVAPALVPPGLLPSAVSLSFDGRVLAFCALTSLVVGLLFGVAPAWHATGRSMMEALASDRRSTARSGAFRSLLVIGEIAAAVLVLSGSGLLLRSLIALENMDPGNRAREVLTMTMNLPMQGPTRYGTPALMRDFYAQLEAAVKQVPGVQNAAIGSAVPLDGAWSGQLFTVVGDPPNPAANRTAAVYSMVSPSYFDTLDIPVLRGRGFEDTDTSDALPVCLVNEAFVRQNLGNRDAVGMQLAIPSLGGTNAGPVIRRIVGVVRQTKVAPAEPRPVPQIYVPMAQNPGFRASISVRPASGPAAALAPAVIAAIARVDSDRPVSGVRTLDTVAFEAVARPRFRTVLVGSFAMLALTLAMVGVFGVLSYSVQQRVREFGVRMAMGASVADVLRLVLGGAARLTVVGLVVGLGAAAALSRYLGTLIFPVPPLDPVTFAAVPLVLIATATLAVLAPALRAARVDPMVAFRSE